LTYLRNYCEVEEAYLAYNIDSLETSGDGKYSCPDCGTILVYNKTDARAILRDEITSEVGQRFAEIALGGGNLDD